MTTPDWTRAACLGAGPKTGNWDLFFPELPARNRHHWKKLFLPVAETYCRDCPLGSISGNGVCGEYADRTESPGIWDATWRFRRNGEYQRRPILDSGTENAA